MKRSLGLTAGAAVLALGVWSAVALGAPGDHRKPSHVKAATTATTTTTAQTPDEANGAPGPMVWVCHHTGSWKHPNHLIHIATHARHAHLANDDVLAGAGHSCPTAATADAEANGHGHGHGPGKEHAAGHGKGHGQGKGPGTHPSGDGDDEDDATETDDA